MGFLDRLLGRKEAQSDTGAAVAEPECPHAALVPRWDSADDIGNPERIASYTCESCHNTFSRDEGQPILAEAAKKLRIADEQRID